MKAEHEDKIGPDVKGGFEKIINFHMFFNNVGTWLAHQKWKKALKRDVGRICETQPPAFIG